jgi:hypothetical protein
VDVGEVNDVVTVADDIVGGVVLPAGEAVSFRGFQEILGEIRSGGFEADSCTPGHGLSVALDFYPESQEFKEQGRIRANLA